MADNTVRQLLHDLEKTIHERLQMVDEYIVRRMPDNVLLARIEKLEEEIKQLRQPMIPSNPLVGIEVITKEVITKEPLKKDLILEAPDRINEADRLLLNSTARKALEQEEQEEQEEDEQQEEQDEQDNEEKDEELFLEKEQEEQQAQVEEEEEAEAEEAEAEEEEEEGQEVEEFEYKGATYYRDTEKNVYMLNEEGALTQIGVWSDVKARIIVKKPDA